MENNIEEKRQQLEKIKIQINFCIEQILTYETLHDKLAANAYKPDLRVFIKQLEKLIFED